MNYIALMQEAIDYIEGNMGKSITIGELSDHFYISKYYFIRIFKALTGQNVKEYILGRKLARGAEMLLRGEHSVLDVALDCGFSSHELFARNFKKTFLISPSDYRKTRPQIAMQQKAVLLERDFKNLNNDLVVSFETVHLELLCIKGLRTNYDPQEQRTIDRLTPFTKRCLDTCNSDDRMDRLYNIAESGTDGCSFFVGFEPDEALLRKPALAECLIPASIYAVFCYNRDMGDIHTTAMQDICRSVMLSGLQMKKEGIDFIVVFEREYHINGSYRIYVPIR